MLTKYGVDKISTSKIEEMIKNRTICDIYNPIKEFFNTLPKWDGVDYFEKICNYIDLDPDENTVFFQEMLKKHIVRSVRCALEVKYAHRVVLTFHGPQRVGKTKFFEWLCPTELYNQENIDPGDKDSILALSRYLIINMDDIDSLNRKEVSKLKGFISKGDITKRLPYARNDEKFNRVASFVASTNKSDILTDESNTRWLILKIKKFNWREYVKLIDPWQIWAQAKALYDEDHESGEMTSEEEEMQELRNNQQFLETSPEREILLKYFTEQDDSPMTATDIRIAIEERFKTIKVNMHQLTRELKRLYGEPKKTSIGGVSGRYYNLVHTLGKNEYREYEQSFHEVSQREVDKPPF